MNNELPEHETPAAVEAETRKRADKARGMKISLPNPRIGHSPTPRC